ncbi:tryptase-2-like protein [Dinothrombium tinctorium]|uniref:Tryptase-2-like protein n=1 Tax=Dinothrombium tinctorium TaxID=1965070 RepID=A0A443QC57_9ACAR|nr:tryptase-2-like protein [Dinothrombium tinctorium]
MLVALFGKSCATKREKRYANGHEAKPYAWPWQVLMLTGEKDWNICGGSLISAEFVLTAAHCVRKTKEYDPNNLKLVLGEHRRSKFEGKEVFAEVAEIIRQPNYETQNHSNDMALIKLKQPINFAKYRHLRPACLQLEKPISLKETRCIGTGWGRINSSGTMPDVLQQLEMKEFCRCDCADIHEEWYHNGPSYERVTKNHICMVSAENSDRGVSYGGVCAGDSGSPLQCLIGNIWKQVGVAWSGTDCEKNPSVFNRVDAYAEWILKVSGYETPHHCNEHQYL